jgi:murein DD-endopeptidase MepM/ murein hydrolase activator NlpD
MRIAVIYPTCLFLIVLLNTADVTGQEFSEASPTGLAPVYPEEFVCSPITSPFGSMTDLDLSRRSQPHVGIDLGNPGDVVIAPANGTVRAIWRVQHEWGNDWNVLIIHVPADLNLPKSPVVYFAEFDHLQSDDIAHLKAGDRLRRGDRIGVVRHPGNNSRFRAEVHLEVYEVPANRQNEISWHTDLGFRYWLNPSAQVIDPLYLLAHHQNEIVNGKVEIVPFLPDGDYRDFRGFTYPLFCPEG